MCRSGRHEITPDNLVSNGARMSCKACRNLSRETSRGACTFEGCAAKRHAKDLCARHYERLRIHGFPGWEPMSLEEVVAEVKWLMSFGVGVGAVSSALQKTPGAIAASLYRSGEPELAAEFEMIRRGAA